MNNLQFFAVLILITVLGTVAVHLGILISGRRKGDIQIIESLQTENALLRKKGLSLKQEFEEQVLRTEAISQLYCESEKRLNGIMTVLRRDRNKILINNN